MKSIVPIIIVTVLIACHAGAETNSTILVQVDASSFGDTSSLMKIVELERNAKTSKLRLTYKKLGSAVGSSMFIMRGFYEVAKARGTEYFVNLKEWSEEQGSRIFIAGFTNNKDADIKKEFGEEFSSESDHGQKRLLLSTSQFKMVFEGGKNGAAPSAATNRGFSSGSGRVELKVLKVFSAKDGDAVFRAYQVRWKDQDVVAADTLAKTDYHEGDNAPVMVMKLPSPYGEMLSFRIMTK